MLRASPYITTLEADTLLSNREDWIALPSHLKTLHVSNACDFLDYNWEFEGGIINVSQEGSWPRTGLVDNDGRAVTGIPDAVKCAVAELAYHSSLDQLTAPDHGAISSESKSIGAISKSVTYSGSKSVNPRFPSVELRLRQFLRRGGSFVLERA